MTTKINETYSDAWLVPFEVHVSLKMAPNKNFRVFIYRCREYCLICVPSVMTSNVKIHIYQNCRITE